MDDLTPEQMIAEVSASDTPVNDAPPIDAAPPVPWWQEKLKDELEYTIDGGKKVKEPFEMVLKRAGLGYNYAQKAHVLNQKEEHYRTVEERNKALARWEEYDKYAKTNPDWAKHVEDGWNNRTNLSQSNQDQKNNPEVAALTEKLSKLEKWYEESQQKDVQAKAQAEDQQMAEEISGVSKTYGVDLAQADEQGRSLEWRVLDHMEKLGIDKVEFKPGQFLAAFKDYYFDNLLDLKKEQEKEKQVKSQAERSRAGILDVSRTPKGPKDSSNGYQPGMSWNQSADAAVEYLRQLKQQ